MYIVIEIQTNENGTIGTLVNAYEDVYQAEQKYHTVLAAAAASTLPRHAAAMLDDAGMYIKGEYYEHGEVNNE